MASINYSNYELMPIARSAEDFVLLYSHSDKNLDVMLDGSGMQLRKLTFWERLFNWIPCLNKGRIARLTAYVNRIYNQPLQLSDADAKKFYSKLRAWKHIKVDLSKFSEPILERLSPDFFEARTAFKYVSEQFISRKDSLDREELKQAKSSYDRHLWKALYAETQLAAELGIGPELTKGGVNGAKFGLGLDGKKLLVIKENGVDRRPRWKTEAFVKGQRTQPQVCDHDPRVAGAVAYMASEHFGFDIVPPTFTDGRGVSAQLFINDVKPADQGLFGLFGKTKLSDRDPEKLTSNEMELLQIKAVFNYLVGDLDGKDDKLFLQIEKNGHFSKIYETDNDNTFPEKPLSKKTDFVTVFFKIHQWKNHKWAKEKLVPMMSPKLFAILEKLYNPHEMEMFRAQVESRYPGFFSEGRWNLLQERLALIKTACDRQLPVSKLGKVYSREYYERPADPEDILHAQLFNHHFSDQAPLSIDQYAQRFERLERS